MRIQIRSFVKGGNHGQYLQALGLQQVLRKIFPNALVSHLNYENHFYKELKIQSISGMLPKFVAMRSYWKKNLVFSPFTAIPDVSIYGSDMIWHMGSSLFPTDQVFFGQNDGAPKKIAYAPSVGCRVTNEPYWAGERLGDFAAIGVRDYGTKNFVHDNCQLLPQLVIDPCFYLLGTKFFELKKINKNRNKVSIYSPMSKVLMQKISSFFGDNHSIELLGYFPRQKFFKYFFHQVTDPILTVQKIACSDILITSTFHGVMMSLMTKTPFIVISSPNLIARLNSPISKTFSKNRIISKENFNRMNSDEFEKFFDFSDYDENILRSYIQESKSWLKNSIEKNQLLPHKI